MIHVIFIPILGFGILLTSVLIPIGFHGTEAVASYTAPWISTADAMRLKYSFIERVVFMLLSVYISLSLLFIIVVWHVGQEMLLALFPVKRRQRKALRNSSRDRPVLFWLLGLGIGFGGVTFVFMLPERSMLSFVEAWLSIRLLADVVLMGTLVWILAKRRRSA